MKKVTVVQRLNIINGQIDGLVRLIKKEENCNKTIEQFSAINVAFKKALELYLKENLSLCLKSVDSRNRKTIDFLLKEIIKNK